MELNVTEKIIESHFAGGKKEAGETVELDIDQTLTQDATGTLTYLELEKIGLARVKTELSVSYVDHNTLQADFKNPDDHQYLRSIARRYGLFFSGAGDGICHRLHLEKFARPGSTLLGSDSHTPTAGGAGALAIGSGGLDVACAMAGRPLEISYPQVVQVRLRGSLPDWVSAKDVVLELLRRVDVDGGRGKVFEYSGPGLRELSVPDRATITNMGTETGATSSVFPSDEVTKEWLNSQGREEDWTELKADPGATYAGLIEIDLSNLQPLVAVPHSPGEVREVSQLEGKKLDQVAIGSCTNSSLRDLTIAAKVLEGEKVSPGLSLLVNPGSRQVVDQLLENGAYRHLVDGGARILENACGPCIGMGGAPRSGGKTLRTYNRNFKGRSGTADAEIFLSSPEVAAASAIQGEIVDPRRLGPQPDLELREAFHKDDGLIEEPLPEEEAQKVEVKRGPNIKPLPDFPPLSEEMRGEVLIKVGDDITTDHIMPAGAEILPLRSNIPEISRYVFSGLDKDFSRRAREKGGGFIVGGENYGQGSSREHAAVAPKYLGVKAVLAPSFSRIHRSNLINFGILPLRIRTKDLEQGMKLKLEMGDLDRGRLKIKGEGGLERETEPDFSEKEIAILKSGGLLPYVRDNL